GGLRAERLLIQGWVGSAKQSHRRASWKRQKLGTANGNRTRISALKGPRANRCTIAARLKELRSINYTGNGRPPKADAQPTHVSVGDLQILRARPFGSLQAWIRLISVDRPRSRAAR